MEICIFAHNYLPNLGGVERYLYNTSNELIKRGHKVTIVTNNTVSGEQYEKMSGVNVYRLPCFKLLNGRFPVLKYNKLCRELIKKVSEKKYDYIIVTPRFYIHSFFGVHYAKKRKIPSLVIEHGTGHFTVNNAVLDFAGRIYEHMITFLVKCNAKNYAGVSRACNKWLEHFHITTDLTLYNSVSLEDIESIKNTVDFRKKYNIPDGGVIVTYTGRLIAEKGIVKLINACKKIDNVYLFIAGDGELYNQIKSIKSKNIIPLGKLEFESVVTLLRQSDIYCLPTDFAEGLPTSVLEAIACKCYVITTKAGGSKEIITDKNYGTILEKNTVDEIKKEIKYVLGNREKCNLAVQRAYEKVEQNYTWKKTVDNLVSIINSQL